MLHFHQFPPTKKVTVCLQLLRIPENKSRKCYSLKICFMYYVNFVEPFAKVNDILYFYLGKKQMSSSLCIINCGQSLFYKTLLVCSMKYDCHCVLCSQTMAIIVPYISVSLTTQFTLTPGVSKYTHCHI